MGGESTHLPVPDREPTLRLQLNDCCHPATAAFVQLVDCCRLLDNAFKNVLRHLYQPFPGAKIPPTRSVTLILRDMDGVAYCTGTELDDDHKEIHFSLRHIANVMKDRLRCRDEIIGVVTHEMVHAWQYNCLGNAPGGLIEGIADYVRLKSGLAPPHWKRQSESNPKVSEPKATLTSESIASTSPIPETSKIPEPEDQKQSSQNDSMDTVAETKKEKPRWDAGYERTAFFLDWLETKYGHGTIAGMNETMRATKYDEKTFWMGLFDKEVDVLFSDYQESLKTPSDVSICGSEAELVG